MSISRRKNDHLRLTKLSQVGREQLDKRFNYEPLLGIHPQKEKSRYSFLGKDIGGPLFLSSITGGSRRGKKVNRNIALAARELNLPMGLGSIRPYLEMNCYDSFNLRSIIGINTPLFGNIGITQIMELLENKTLSKLEIAIDRLNLDGLIIHINPLQEWIQPEGDNLYRSPLTILNESLTQLKCKKIVKEVGCGFGPRSIEALMKSEIDVIDFAAFGGTNFTKMELLRCSKNKQVLNQPFINIGNTPDDMIATINSLTSKGIGKDKEFIISGGVKNFLDGYYYNSILNAPSIYAYAAKILTRAQKSTESLIAFLDSELKSYTFAQNYLDIKK